MSINERFFKLLSEKKCSQKQFSNDTGVSEKTISAWKLRKSDPPANLISTIADYFGVSVTYLLEGSEEPFINDVQTKQLLGLYNELTEVEQQIILHKTAEMYYERVRKAEMDLDKKPPMTDSSQQSSEEPPHPIPFAASGEADIKPENYADIQMRLQKYDKRAKELEGK